jgi:hypothetical protein
MSVHLNRLLLCLGLAAAGAAGVAAAAETAAPPPQNIVLRVQVDAAGKVTASKPLDPNAIPALAQAAQDIAGKLQFTPARKGGRGVPSETSLSLTLALEPRAGGGFGIGLRRAQNGPSVVELGKSQPPKVSAKENGGVVVVGVDLRPDGSCDMETFKEEKVELRVPSTFAGERFVEAARNALKGTRFLLDKVDGIETPSRISVPFQFNGGSARHEPGEEAGHARAPKAEAAPPSLTAVSRIEGVELPKIDYTAPAK